MHLPYDAVHGRGRFSIELEKTSRDCNTTTSSPFFALSLTASDIFVMYRPYPLVPPCKDVAAYTRGTSILCLGNIVGKKGAVRSSNHHCIHKFIARESRSINYIDLDIPHNQPSTNQKICTSSSLT